MGRRGAHLWREKGGCEGREKKDLKGNKTCGISVNGEGNGELREMGKGRERR